MHVVVPAPAPSPLRDRSPKVADFPPARWGDQELVNAVARGDGSVLGVIWSRYASLVRGVLRSTLGPRGSVEDLLQDVFFALVKGAGGMRDGAALRGFLIGTAVRLAAQDLRRRKVRRWVSLTQSGVLPDAPVAPSDAEGREALEALYRFLDRLKSRRRFAFVLYHVQGLELKEVASALGISESTAKREAARAREQLRAHASRDPVLRDYTDWFQGGRL